MASISGQAMNFNTEGCLPQYRFETSTCSRHVRFLTESRDMKDFFATDAATNQGNTITSFFVVVSKQTRQKKNGEP